MSDWDSCDMPQFYSEQFPVARKAHNCVECHAPIDQGEKHLRYGGKWEGEIGGGRQHMACRDLCMLMNFEGDGCCAFGGMKEAWLEGDWGRREYRDDKRYAEARTLMARIIRRERVALRAARRAA